MFFFSDSALKWVTYLNKQYSQYSRDHLADSFANAQKLCENVGAMLPEPRNAVENAYVANSISISQWFFLGLKMTKTPGVWVWRSDGSTVTWNNWIIGGQLAGPSHFDYCGAMSPNKKWFAAKCLQKRNKPVICERDITSKYNRHHETKQTHD